MKSIKVGIVGYGNLGRGVQFAAAQNPDIEVVGVFTRRDPQSVKTVLPVLVESLDNIEKYQDKIDVLALCLGSATDLPGLGPRLAEKFCTVDTFDNHAKIPEYLKKMQEVSQKHNTVSAISVGWDPGVFSLTRGLFGAIAPNGKHYTFWGKGVSQGHSDALRRIEGVKNAIQYTIPKTSALEEVRKGTRPNFTAREMHARECFVVLKEGADPKQVEEKIKTMPDYFAPYDVTVHFIDEEEFLKNHTAMPHGGFVMRSAESATGNKFHMELNLQLESNPEFTSSVVVAYCRAVAKLKEEGKTGAFTVLDVPFTYLNSVSREELIRTLL